MIPVKGEKSVSRSSKGSNDALKREKQEFTEIKAQQ
jgi:hypothetical protein